MNSNNGTGGYLYNRIRYLRNKKSSPDNQQNIRNDDMSTTADTSFQGYEMDALLYLKTTIVSDQNLADFKEKLKMTLDIRMKMIKVDKVDFLEYFPFMFVRPLLVSMVLIASRRYFSLSFH